MGRGEQQPPGKPVEADREFEKGPASETILSMSQALLAPLDAILKAQVHAARSFLNFLMQIGYPHQPTAGRAGGPAPPPQAAAGPGSAGGGDARDEGVPYRMDFDREVDG